MNRGLCNFVFGIAVLGVACGQLDLEGRAPEGLPHFATAARWRSTEFSARTELDSAGRLRIVSNLPFEANGMRDDDRDGISDEWELMVLGKLRPVVRLHEKEQLLSDHEASVGAVARVSRAPDGRALLVVIVLAYRKDYGSCTVSEHWGDSERVVLRLEKEQSHYVMTGAYTSAHEGTSTDDSKLVQGPDLRALQFVDDPVSGDLRWMVFASKSKHANYISAESCRAHSSMPCFREACAAMNEEGVDLLFPIVDAGEDGVWIDETLDGFSPVRYIGGSLGVPAVFWGESAWSGEAFCGGIPVQKSGCASSLKEKLSSDPFTDESMWRTSP